MQWNWLHLFLLAETVNLAFIGLLVREVTNVQNDWINRLSPVLSENQLIQWMVWFVYESIWLCSSISHWRCAVITWWTFINKRECGLSVVFAQVIVWLWQTCNNKSWNITELQTSNFQSTFHSKINSYAFFKVLLLYYKGKAYRFGIHMLASIIFTQEWSNVVLMSIWCTSVPLQTCRYVFPEKSWP